MRAIDADRLIDDLKHDVAMDQDSLDYEELTDSNRERIQFDKDCKQNAIDLLQNAPTIKPEPCEYCHEDSDGYVKPVEKNCHAFIRFGMDGWELSLKANGWHGSAKIRYCPMCGRKLEK